MARAVVLMFEDNGEAEMFVDSMTDNGEGDVVIDRRKFPDDPVHLVPARAVAMYAIPTQFCECPPVDPDGPGKRGSGRYVGTGEKFGWDVHRACGKPIEGNHLVPKNLIPDMPPTLHPLWTLIGKGAVRG